MKTTKHKILAFALISAISTVAMAADDNKTDVDNSKMNERDRSGETLTTGDQSNNPEDLKITQAIRLAVMKDDSLSMMAKNVKIITTAGGQVTLRGPVNTIEEKTKIESLAKSAAGVAKVDNQIEVKAGKDQ